MGPLRKGRSFALLVFVGIVLLFAKCTQGANISGQIYFTMPSVRLTVPMEGLPEGEPLLRVQASSEVTKNLSEGRRHPLISYQLAKPSQMLRLDPHSGYLFLSARAKATAAASLQEQATIKMVPAVIASGIAVNESGHMLVQIATLPSSNGNKLYCEGLPQQSLCFWDSFSFAIMENRPPTKLGGLRPLFLQQLCPHFSAFYKVVEGSNDLFQVFHSPDNWYLHTKYSFDREVVEWVEAHVECHLNNTKDGSITGYQRRINVTILDQDDCPPNAQEMELDININDPLVKKGDTLYTGKLIISDDDTENVNVYKVEMLEESDPPGLLHLTLQSVEVPARKHYLIKFKPSQKIPDVYKSFGRTRSSAIHIGLTIAKTIKLTNPMYTTTFILKDTSLHGEQDKAQVKITLRLMVASQDKFEKDAGGNKKGQGSEPKGIIDGTANEKNHCKSCWEICFIAVALGIVAALVIALAGSIYARRKPSNHGCHQLSEMATAIPLSINPHDGTAERMAAVLRTINPIYGQDGNGSQILELLPLRTNHHVDMPIDPKWELPRSSLKLEEILGEGDFGLVYRGKLKSPNRQAKCPTSPGINVAVKTLKMDAGEMERHALVSEFKLLQGVNHANVVRLIGACTIPKNQSFLLVIEYAELGSLRKYMRKIRLGINDSSSLQRVRIVAPESNIHPKEECGDLITPRHILSFAWQISKGMAYLSKMKLVHRDLAARNLLLSSNGYCKISDFGLARDVYKGEIYYKRSNGKVPVKWLAPESLSDQIYTTQSDVWGFGILLWELVTLGSIPYPDVPLIDMYSHLRGGYRLEKPQNCSDELYSKMRACWTLEPRKRPTFQSLVASFEQMLQDQEDYLELRSIIKQNLKYFHSPIEETCHSLSGDRVQYTSIRHDPVTTDHEDIAVNVPATQTQRKIEPENATEKTVEYTWLSRRKRITKRRWMNMRRVYGKKLSQGLLPVIEELDEDNSGLDSTHNSESEPALNEDKTNNEDAAKDECPIKSTEQSECTAMESPTLTPSAEPPIQSNENHEYKL